MEPVVVMYKKRGETPLEALGRLRKERPEYAEETLSYAGRLDPLAEGALLVLVGEENKKREQYLALTKEYQCDVLFGFSTDTDDVMGKLTAAPTIASHPRVSAGVLLAAVSRLTGTREEEYPLFSSKTVKGKPLHEWAREGKAHDIEIPKHSVTVFESVLLGLRTAPVEKLWQGIDADIGSVSGDFRQKEIRDTWWEHIRPLYGETVDIATIHLKVGSGAYIRTLARRLGEALGIPALALRIVRTRVGDDVVLLSAEKTKEPVS